MKPVWACVTVFNRYDLLRKLMASIERSLVRPEGIYLIDRGHDEEQVLLALKETTVPYLIVDLPGQCLAAAWNWFIINVPEERILVSDDIEFAPESIGEMIETPGDVVGIADDRDSSAYACFLLRNSAVQKVGLFDEGISPDYMYFEDCDYAHRMRLVGAQLGLVRSIYHHGQQSLAHKTPAQMANHHRQFIFANSRYLQKWGGNPGSEQFKTPFNKEVMA